MCVYVQLQITCTCICTSSCTYVLVFKPLWLTVVPPPPGRQGRRSPVSVRVKLFQSNYIVLVVVLVVQLVLRVQGQFWVTGLGVCKARSGEIHGLCDGLTLH